MGWGLLEVGGSGCGAGLSGGREAEGESGLEDSKGTLRTESKE